MIATTAQVTRSVPCGRQYQTSLQSSRSAFAGRAPRPAATRCRALPAPTRARRLRVLAFREGEKIQDWRVQQMVDLAHSYFIDFLTNKRAELSEQIFSEEVMHVDVVWDPTHPTVGIQGMRHYLADLNTAFPDFWVEVDQYATVDTNSVMVTFRGSATNLGEYHNHKPTHHASSFEGCNILKFNHDRSRITEIKVFRSAFAEDLDELGERKMAEEGGFRELRLQRLA